MKVVNMGNISDAFRFDNLPATGIVIEATPEELKLLPNLAYKDVTISEHVGNAPTYGGPPPRYYEELLSENARLRAALANAAGESEVDR